MKYNKNIYGEKGNSKKRTGDNDKELYETDEKCTEVLVKKTLQRAKTSDGYSSFRGYFMNVGKQNRQCGREREGGREIDR